MKKESEKRKLEKKARKKIERKARKDSEEIE